jgi:hypothetical protein
LLMRTESSKIKRQKFPKVKKISCHIKMAAAKCN